MSKYGSLYIIATPIGNLEDITLRAIRVLNDVDCILCEDTRVTRKLLDKYNIKTKTISYHAHSSNKKESGIIDMLESGKNLALVSDAGTPTISDPGVMLIGHVIEALGSDIRIIPVPGPSALVSALSASGLSSATFTFYGFLPHKKGRETLFKEIAASKRMSVFYESSHRISKTLESLEKYIPDRGVVIAREMTKVFEEFLRGKPKELIKLLRSDKNKEKGEFVVIVAPK